MSQQEFFDLQNLVASHAVLLQREVDKTRAGWSPYMDLAQIKFIVSLYPIPPDVAV